MVSFEKRFKKKKKKYIYYACFQIVTPFFWSGFGTNALLIIEMERGSAKNQKVFKLFISFIVCVTTTGAGNPTPVEE